MSLSLDAPVTALAGIGPRRAPLLLYHRPFRYENRLRFTPIGELRPGVVTCVQAEVLTAGLVRYRRSRRRAFHAAVGDQSGILYAKWFYGDYLVRLFRPGQRVVIYGKVEEDPYRPGQLQMLQPQHQILSGGREPDSGEPVDQTESGRLVPIYEDAGPVTSR